MNTSFPGVNTKSFILGTILYELNAKPPFALDTHDRMKSNLRKIEETTSQQKEKQA